MAFLSICQKKCLFRGIEKYSAMCVDLLPYITLSRGNIFYTGFLFPPSAKVVEMKLALLHYFRFQ